MQGESLAGLEQEAQEAVDESTTHYLGEAQLPVGRALWQISPQIKFFSEPVGATLSVLTNEEPRIFFAQENELSVCRAALEIAARSIGCTLIGRWGDQTFTVQVGQSADEALATWESDAILANWAASAAPELSDWLHQPETSVGPASDDDMPPDVVLCQTIRDIQAEYQQEYRRIQDDTRRAVHNIGRDHLGKDGVEVATVMCNIMPAVVASTNALRAGRPDQAAPILARTGQQIHYFARALEIIAKVNGYTYVGIFHGRQCIVTPGMSAKDIYEQWRGDQPSEPS